ncbi:exodeoxyribonuclease VII large subunit, partial [bacterium]|nr:exodeoxyribonuclease VII large subunit [bacterium]
ERVGLVTSPTGAALQDILRVARERAPWVEFLLAPAAVQGAAAAAELAAAVKALDQTGTLDLIIIGRGGGSAEDLWAFNEEVVVRAVANCVTPIVSAVGHEVDVSLSDLAADLRAPTPSAAAEMCLPDREALRERLNEAQIRLQRSLQTRITEARNWLKDRAGTVIKQSIRSIWREESQRTDELARRLEQAISRLTERRRSLFERLSAKHNVLNPLGILERGYAVVRRAGRTEAITGIAQLAEKDLVEITLHHGKADAQIKKLRLL